MSHSGLCECGCGQPTLPSTKHQPKRGYIKGQPQRFVVGHNRVAGTGTYYRETKVAGERSYEHIQVAMKALGRALPAGAQVHHVNGKRRDNRPENLVVCQDVAYHKLLHRRQRALTACGNPDWLKCYICKVWDDPDGLVVRKNELSAAHRACLSERSRRKYIEKATAAGRPVRKSRYQPGQRGRCAGRRELEHEDLAGPLPAA